jgi:hypothetical protein
LVAVLILEGLGTEGRQMHAAAIDLRGSAHEVAGREPNHLSGADGRRRLLCCCAHRLDTAARTDWIKALTERVSGEAEVPSTSMASSA